MNDDEYTKLLDSIVKGAKYIEMISPTDAKWKKANEKYDLLVAEARSISSK